MTIIHGNIVTPDRIIENGSLVIGDGRIIGVEETLITLPEHEVYNHCGNWITPGLIDIHVHGGGGADFMDATTEAYLTILNTHARYGTTAIMPTTLTATNEDLKRSINAYKAADQQNRSGAKMIGMHLEGPYFSPLQAGAQDPRFIRNPNPEEYEPILENYDVIKRWSAAPELTGSLQFARTLRDRGILVSIAHTDSVYEEVEEAFEAGFTLMTHLYSAMTTVHRRGVYRHAGTVEAAYLIDEMDVEIIADGIHLPPPLLRLITKFKNNDRIALVTDAMRGAGMPEGEYMLGHIESGMKVIVEDGVAKLPDRTAFAGSVATADRLVRNMVQKAGLSMVDAVKMMTVNPARIMNLHNQGALREGFTADVAVFNQSLNVIHTIIDGKTVYITNQ